MSDELEELWGEILSEEADRVREAFASLVDAEKAAVYTHLQHMAADDGWTIGQRQAALAALAALANYFDSSSLVGPVEER